jgi:hypothetical protein
MDASKDLSEETSAAQGVIFQDQDDGQVCKIIKNFNNDLCTCLPMFLKRLDSRYFLTVNYMF